MITPEQALRLSASGAAMMAADRTPLSVDVEAVIDDRLILHGRAVVTSVPVAGAVLAAPEFVRELARRYRDAGWVTTLRESAVVIERPP